MRSEEHFRKSNFTVSGKMAQWAFHLRESREKGMERRSIIVESGTLLLLKRELRFHHDQATADRE